MSERTGTEQSTVGAHIRNAVFAEEVAALSKVEGEEEFLSVASDYLGILEFETNKSGTTVSDLNAKWTAHKEGCSDCTGWRLL